MALEGPPGREQGEEVARGQRVGTAGQESLPVVSVAEGGLRYFHRFEEDGDPSPIGPGIVDVLDGPTRITQPHVRRGWYEGGPGTGGDRRGVDDYIPVSWDEANRLVADELTRVTRGHGNSAIYAGSYGWASAGRFHHAQSQLKRFLNTQKVFASGER